MSAIYMALTVRASVVRVGRERETMLSARAGV
jgi:hypothetical protein